MRSVLINMRVSYFIGGYCQRCCFVVGSGCYRDQQNSPATPEGGVILERNERFDIDQHRPFIGRIGEYVGGRCDKWMPHVPGSTSLSNGAADAGGGHRSAYCHYMWLVPADDRLDRGREAITSRRVGAEHVSCSSRPFEE